MKTLLPLIIATGVMLNASSYAQSLEQVFTQQTLFTAAQNPQLLFTEESETLLTAKLDGADFGAGLNTSPDHWTWRIPASGDSGGFTFEPSPSLLWAEPDSATLVNRLVATGTFLDHQLVDIGFDIGSDADLGPVSNVHANGTYGFTVTLVSGLGSFGPVDVSFLDLGDSVRTPDSGSTGLFLLGSAGSLIAAAGLRRRSC